MKIYIVCDMFGKKKFREPNNRDCLKNIIKKSDFIFL